MQLSHLLIFLPVLGALAHPQFNPLGDLIHELTHPPKPGHNSRPHGRMVVEPEKPTPDPTNYQFKTLAECQTAKDKVDGRLNECRAKSKDWKDSYNACKEELEDMQDNSGEGGNGGGNRMEMQELMKQLNAAQMKLNEYENGDGCKSKP